MSQDEINNKDQEITKLKREVRQIEDQNLHIMKTIADIIFR